MSVSATGLSLDDIGMVLTAVDGAALLRIQVTARTARDRLGPVIGDRLKVAVRAPALEGRANDAVVVLVARELGLRRSAVTLVQGHQARQKVLRLEGVAPAVIAERLRVSLSNYGPSGP